MEAKSISIPALDPRDFSPENDWPVDVPRTNESREVDLGQLEYLLSLTPLERIRQNDAWVNDMQAFRAAGRRAHGL